MWQLLGFWLAALTCLAHAASEGAGLWLYQPKTTGWGSARTISPDTARLLIASRLGLDSFLDLATQDEQALRNINELGGKQQLFAGRLNDEPVAFVLANGLRAEDIEALNADAIVAEHELHQMGFAVNPKQSLKFVEDMATLSQLQAGQAQHTAAKIAELNNGEAVVFGTHPFQVTSDVQILSSVLSTLAKQEYTILVLVPSTYPSTTATFGTVAMPAPVQRRQNREALLADTTFAAAPALLSTLVPLANHSVNQSTPLRGILPGCYTSLSTCQAITRNCTGHGACTLKYTDKDASTSGAPCYSCACTADVRTNADGTKKTTRWGGPACQKKDVVMPFWLLAGFSIFLISLISWGIGNLVSMGNEELPSVIGAGVSGVPRRS